MSSAIGLTSSPRRNRDELNGPVHDQFPGRLPWPGSGDTGFGLTATPITVGSTGQDSYCIDTSGVMLYNTSGLVITDPAGVCDATQPPLQ
jgi:hypothetical protein